ncbi:hypothetical protein C1645_853199, partial [Glomus cerebriforme]
MYYKAGSMGPNAKWFHLSARRSRYNKKNPFSCSNTFTRPSIHHPFTPDDYESIVLRYPRRPVQRRIFPPPFVRDIYYRLLNDVKALIRIYLQCSSDNQIRIRNKLRDAFELYNHTWAIGRHAEDFLRSIGDLSPYSEPRSTQIPDLFYLLD